MRFEGLGFEAASDSRGPAGREAAATQATYLLVSLLRVRSCSRRRTWRERRAEGMSALRGHVNGTCLMIHIHAHAPPGAWGSSGTLGTGLFFACLFACAANPCAVDPSPPWSGGLALSSSSATIIYGTRSCCMHIELTQISVGSGERCRACAASGTSRAVVVALCTSHHARTSHHAPLVEMAREGVPMLDVTSPPSRLIDLPACRIRRRGQRGRVAAVPAIGTAGDHHLPLLASRASHFIPNPLVNACAEMGIEMGVNRAPLSSWLQPDG